MPEPISHHAQLFLDDHLVDDQVNLCREMQQPVKHPGNPLFGQDHPWEDQCLVYVSVLFDEDFGRFRCWYMAAEAFRQTLPDQPEIAKLGKYYICYAESTDGIHWTKPAVGRPGLSDHVGHNIVIPGGHGVCVLKTPDDPDPRRRYKAAGGNVLACSPDGIDWTLRDWIDAVGKNDTCPSLVQWKGQYLAYVRNQEEDPSWPGIMRGVGLCVSDDFDHWTPKSSIFTTDGRDGYPWSQPHALGVTPYGDVLIGLLPTLEMVPEPGNNLLGDMPVQLVVSRDGRQWHRVADRAVFMPQAAAGPIGQRPWDVRFHPASHFFVKDDVVHLYYYGSPQRWGEGAWLNGRQKFGHHEDRIGEAQDLYPARLYGVGLATLPADRFVSVRPVNWAAEGRLTTVPVTCRGRDLLVNAAIDVGSLAVELLDEHGAVIPGYDRSRSRFETHDALRCRVTWQDDGGERPLAAALQNHGEIAFRFILHNCELFSFQVTDHRRQ